MCLFCNELQCSHEEAVNRICRTLLHTKNQGLVMKPDWMCGLECNVDADWAGSWQDRSFAGPFPNCFLLMYAGCRIMWD